MSACHYVVVRDCQIRIVTVCKQGPSGPPGGGIGFGDLNYLHVQATPSPVWVVVHNLGKFPSITAMIGPNNRNMGARVQHLDMNSAEIFFGLPFAGLASCN
jgi:hypothetical protein